MLELEGVLLVVELLSVDRLAPAPVTAVGGGGVGGGERGGRWVGRWVDRWEGARMCRRTRSDSQVQVRVCACVCARLRVRVRVCVRCGCTRGSACAWQRRVEGGSGGPRVSYRVTSPPCATKPDWIRWNRFPCRPVPSQRTGPPGSGQHGVGALQPSESSRQRSLCLMNVRSRA